MTNGNNILIYYNGSVIGGTSTSAERSNELNTSCETIEVSSPTQGIWRNFIPGRKDWSLTVNWLVPAVGNITEALKTGTCYTLSFKDRSGNTLLSGDAICKQCRITSTRGNLVQGSFSFIGNGALEEPPTET